MGRIGAILLLAALWCTISLISAQTDHLRPHFVNSLDADTLTEIYGAQGSAYVNALVPDLMLPLVTPLDQYQFAVNLGETHSFFVVGQWDTGDTPVGTGLSLGVLFEEPASLFAGDPMCQSKPQSERGCVKLEGFEDWCACEALQTELPDGRLANKVFTDAFPNDNRRFGKDELRVCFRILDCSPSAAQGEEQACVLDEMGGFDMRFYPQRCVFVAVLQPPAIHAVHPLDPAHRVEGSETVTVPQHPWYNNATTVDVALNVGELLQLAVDAWDVNEEDDVDIRLSASSAPLPAGAALSPRLCCKEGWEECEERPMGAQDCQEECTTSCAHTSVQNLSVTAACQQTCAPRCQPRPCRYVRRVLHYLGEAARVDGLQFEAFDDSHRLSRLRQVERGEAAPACCNASALVSAPSAPVSVAVRGARPSLAFPSMMSGSHVTAHVGCAMPAIGVFGISADDVVELLPRGCEPATVVRSQVCVEEACSARSDCCCATPPHVCALCLPDIPAGMELSGPLPYSLQPRALPSALPEQVARWHLLGASAQRSDAAGEAAYTLSMRFNGPVPPGTLLLLSGLLHANASTNASLPLTAQELHVEAMGAGDRAVVEGWEPTSGSMRVRLHRSRAMASRDVVLRWRVEAELQLSEPNVTVALEGAGVDTSQWLPVDTAAAGFTGCFNCTAEGLLGEGPAGSGAMRVVRWRPEKTDMGRVFAVCHSVLGANQSDYTRANAPTHCIHFHVARCRYCVQGGETLESIAQLLGTDWLQLWSANAPARLPADALEAGAVLLIGPLHHVQATSKLSTLALQLATTEASLRNVNRDIPDEQLWVEAGRELCVLPGVCDTDVAADGSGVVVGAAAEAEAAPAQA